MTDGNGTQHELGELSQAVRTLTWVMEKLPDQLRAIEAEQRKYTKDQFTKCENVWLDHKQYHKDREHLWGIISWAHKFPFKFTGIVIASMGLLYVLHREQSAYVFSFVAKVWQLF